MGLLTSWATAAFATRGTILAGFGFIDANWTTMQILVIQTLNGRLALIGIGHFNEAEAP